MPARAFTMYPKLSAMLYSPTLVGLVGSSIIVGIINNRPWGQTLLVMIACAIGILGIKFFQYSRLKIKGDIIHFDGHRFQFADIIGREIFKTCNGKHEYPGIVLKLETLPLAYFNPQKLAPFLARWETENPDSFHHITKVNYVGIHAPGDGEPVERSFIKDPLVVGVTGQMRLRHLAGALLMMGVALFFVYYLRHGVRVEFTLYAASHRRPLHLLEWLLFAGTAVAVVGNGLLLLVSALTSRGQARVEEGIIFYKKSKSAPEEAFPIGDVTWVDFPQKWKGVRFTTATGSFTLPFGANDLLSLLAHIEETVGQKHT